MKISARKWYPFGGAHSQTVFPLSAIPEAVGRDVSVRFIGRDDSLALSIKTLSASSFARTVEAGMSLERDRLQRYRRNSDVPAWVTERLSHLDSLIADETPEPLEDGLRCDVIVTADAAALKAQGCRDTWSYIDSVTGGCCNTNIDRVGGQVQYEATLYGSGLPELLENKLLSVVAISAKMTDECLPYCTDFTRDVLSRFPRTETVFEQALQEVNEWQAPRLAQLATAIESFDLGDGRCWLNNGLHRPNCEFTAGILSVETGYSEANGSAWSCRVQGRFDDEGNLLGVSAKDVVRTGVSWEEITFPALKSQRPHA